MIFKKKDWPWPLENETQATVFSQLAQEEGIPFKIVRHGDALFGYATEILEGFGHVETLPEFEKTMEEFYQGFLASDHPEPEEVDED